jgi:hypothetical protein
MREFVLRASILLLLAAPLAGCVREGRIAMPSELQTATERLDLRGMGHGTSGRFELAGARGEFTRSAQRLGIFDPLLVRRSGGGTFRIAGGDVAGELSGRCRYRESEVNAGPVSVTPGRFVYACEFRRDGRPIAAELVVADPAGAGGTLHGRTERVGSLYFEGRRFELASIHRDQGGGLPAPHALGYAFSEAGRPVGAVDLNGGTRKVFAPREAQAREAVIAGALALSILWDPAAIGN